MLIHKYTSLNLNMSNIIFSYLKPTYLFRNQEFESIHEIYEHLEYLKYFMVVLFYLTIFTILKQLIENVLILLKSIMIILKLILTKYL